MRSFHEKEHNEMQKIFELQEYEEASPAKIRKIQVEISAENIRQSCVELVTIHGRSFSLIGDKAFQNFLRPMIDGLPQNDRFPLTLHWIRNESILEYENIKKMIIKELKEV